MSNYNCVKFYEEEKSEVHITRGLDSQGGQRKSLWGSGIWAEIFEDELDLIGEGWHAGGVIPERTRELYVQSPCGWGQTGTWGVRGRMVQDDDCSSHHCVLTLWTWKSLSHVYNPMDESPWNSPGQNTGVGTLSLLQGIFPTQGSNPGLPHTRCFSKGFVYMNSLNLCKDPKR